MMTEEQYIERITELSRALDECYTQQGATCIARSDKRLMIRRLVEINRIVCAALDH
jgi:hypothetical protein